MALSSGISGRVGELVRTEVPEAFYVRRRFCVACRFVGRKEQEFPGLCRYKLHTDRERPGVKLHCYGGRRSAAEPIIVISKRVAIGP